MLHVQPNHVTVDIMGLAPRLRHDLKVSAQFYAGQTCYLIEDPISSRFSRVGLAEYTLISLLDGKTTIAEAMGQAAAIMGPQALSEHEAAALCKWLIDSQLAETEQSRQAGRLGEAAERSAKNKTASRLTPIFQRLPLWNPDSVLRRMVPWVGWIFSGPAVLAWLAVVTCGAYCVGSRWAQFTSHAGTVLARDNWGWLIVTWLLLKLLHEAGHALACTRFGGNVREAGVMLVVLAPFPYVDVTSSWRLDSKWRRIFIATAGMYVELLAAAIMAIIWSRSDNLLLQQHARNVIVTATVVTALFNLNPLMRFDGYYVLCDWLELPNLATHGRKLLRYFGEKLFLAASVTKPTWPEGRTLTVFVYALAAFLWQIFVRVTLVIAAASLFWGAGFVLALAAVVLWIGIPAVRLIVRIASRREVSVRRVAVVAALCCGALVGVNYLPWYSRVKAPVIVDFRDVREVRTNVGGFVQRVLVSEGVEVKAGQLLVVLANRELEWDAERLRIEIAQSVRRARRFRQARQIAALQIEVENRRALETRHRDLRQQLDQLSVRAPIAGTVTRSDLDQLRGTFINVGERILSIGALGNVRLFALVKQQHATVFKSAEAPQARVHIWGSDHRSIAVRFDRVHPRATTKLPHPAFAAACGGTLTVRARLPASDRSDRWELVDPHILVQASCTDTASELAAGQTGVLRLTHYRGRAGALLWNIMRRWLQERGDPAQKEVPQRYKD